MPELNKVKYLQCSNDKHFSLVTNTQALRSSFVVLSYLETDLGVVKDKGGGEQFLNITNTHLKKSLRQPKKTSMKVPWGDRERTHTFIPGVTAPYQSLTAPCPWHMPRSKGHRAQNCP